MKRRFWRVKQILETSEFHSSITFYYAKIVRIKSIVVVAISAKDLSLYKLNNQR